MLIDLTKWLARYHAMTEPSDEGTPEDWLATVSHELRYQTSYPQIGVRNAGGHHELTVLLARDVERIFVGNIYAVDGGGAAIHDKHDHAFPIEIGSLDELRATLAFLSQDAVKRISRQQNVRPSPYAGLLSFRG